MIVHTSRRTWADALLTWTTVYGSIALFTGCFSLSDSDAARVAVPAVLTMLAVGAGYGCNRSWADAFRKQPQRVATP